MLKQTLSLAASLILMVSMTATTHASSISIKAVDTTAGQKAMLIVKGEVDSLQSLSITDPLGNTSQSTFVISENGTAVLFHKNTQKSGKYIAKIDNQITQFNVKPANTHLYQLALSDYSKRLESGRITGSLTVQDTYHNSVIDRKYQISTRKNRVDCGNCVTNEKGQIRFTVQGYQPGFDNLTIHDPLTQTTVKNEEIAFLPPSNTQVANSNTLDAFSVPSSDYIQVYQENDITSLLNSGNSDSFLGGIDVMNLREFIGAQLAPDAPASTESTTTDNQTPDHNANNATTNDTAVVPPTYDVTASALTPTGPHFRIFFEDFEATMLNDPYDPEEEATIDANLAQSFTVVAVSADGNINTDYTGTVTFEANSNGTDLPAPSDYTFTIGDQGVHEFSLSVIFEEGEIIFSVEERDNSSLSGSINILSQESSAIINQTSIALNLTAPTAGATLSGSVNFIGTVSHENIQVAIKEGDNQVAQSNVSQDKSFNIPVSLIDGKHEIEVIAKYLPDNSTVTSTITFNVDTTAPIVTSVSDIEGEVRPGGDFTLTVVSEPNATITAFINNQAYTFPASTSGTFVLNAKAPVDAGRFPVTIEAADKYNNITTVQEPTTLVVRDAASVKNLIGVPEVEGMTLTWDPVVGAATYQVTVKESSTGNVFKSETSQTANITISELDPNNRYSFGVKALDPAGAAMTEEINTIALAPLTPPAIYAAASLIDQDQPLPPRHTNSGPEVYFIIALSILLLDFYAKARRKLQE
jgi:hypothetical protein